MFAGKMNRRSWMAAIAVAALTPTLFLAGCGGDDDDDDFDLFANLSAAQEIPPPQGNPPATGTATVTINEDRTQLEVRVQTTGAFTSPVTAAHIHVITNPNRTGPIVFPLFNAQTQGQWSNQIHLTLTEANFTQSTGVATFQDAINQILAGNSYVNIHTTLNGPGEIRGDLVLDHDQGGGDHD